MNTKTIPATQLKDRVSEVLDSVFFHNNVVIVKRYGKSIAKIVPMKESKPATSTHDLLDRYFGAIPDMPDVKKLRYSRKRNVSL